MDDCERDESITEARIAGTSTRALAKLHRCSSGEVEAAIDRRLSYELNDRQRLRLVKLSVERIMALMAPFFECATKDRDVQAGTLCCKLEERLSLLLGLDHPVQARVDVYQVQSEEQPSSFDRVHDMILQIARKGRDLHGGDGNGQDDPAR